MNRFVICSPRRYPDEKGNVSRSRADDGSASLYAAGEVALAGLFDSEYPCCGTAIGSAVYYERVAAANAVAGKNSLPYCMKAG